MGLLDKVLDIPAAADFEVSLDFAIDRMLNHDILQAAAIVYDGQELRFHILWPMLELEEAVLGPASGLILIEVAAVGADDGLAVSPKQGNVLNDNLPGHLKLLCQGLSVEGTGGLFQNLQ